MSGPRTEILPVTVDSPDDIERILEGLRIAYGLTKAAAYIEAVTLILLQRARIVLLEDELADECQYSEADLQEQLGRLAAGMQ